MNDERKMIAAGQVKGSIFGFDTTFYMDTQKNMACQIELNNDGLVKFLGLFESSTEKMLKEEVNKLTKFSMPFFIGHDSDGGWTIASNSKEYDELRCVIYSGKNGRLVLLDYYVDQVAELLCIDDFGFKEILSFLGVRKLLFCYIQGSPAGGEMLQKILKQKKLDIPSRRTGGAEDSLLLYALVDPEEMSDDASSVRNAFKKIFRINSMELYVEKKINTKELTFYLKFPKISTDIIESSDLSLMLSTGKMISFNMTGAFTFPALNNIGFQMNARFTQTDVEFSASTLPDAVFKIPGTHIVLSNIAIAFGLAAVGVEFGLSMGVTIRELSFFGASHLTFTEAGGIPTIDMFAVAMSEVSFSALAKNIMGIDDPEIKCFDVVSIKPFDIGSSGTINVKKDISKEEVVKFINASGISRDFWVDESSISMYFVEVGGEVRSIRVIDRKRMIHYTIKSREEQQLELPPQFYYASKDIVMGAYHFPQGIFFCGIINFLDTKFKVMFCTNEETGMIGFAQVAKIDCGFLRLTGSEFSKSIENPVISDPDSIVAKLVGKDPGDCAVFYVSIGRDKYAFYLDGHLDLFNGLFGIDTQIIFMSGVLSFCARFVLQGIFSVSLVFAVQYGSIMEAQFRFGLQFDAEPLYEKLNELQNVVREKAEEWKTICLDHEQQIKQAQCQVLSLQIQINNLSGAIEESRKKIKNARWWQFWIFVEEGAKILGYEVGIAALQLSMNIAYAALELALAAVEAEKVIGGGVLDLVDNVISGVMNAFFIRKLNFDFSVENNCLSIKAEYDLTVLNKPLTGEFDVQVGDLKNSIKDFIEEKFIGLVKSIVFDANGSDVIEPVRRIEIDEDSPYSHLLRNYSGPKDLDKMVEDVQEGATRLENGGAMIMELNEDYIKSMYELRPEFEDMISIYKDSAQLSMSLIDRTKGDIYKASSELADYISEKLNKLESRDEFLSKEAEGVKDALKKYRDHTEPAMSNAEEIRNRMKNVVDLVNVEEGKQLLRNLRMNARSSGEAEGLRIMGNRNYDRLYNTMEKVIENYFPEGEESKFIHFGNEYRFYLSLNESRKESGCAYVSPEKFISRDEFRSKGGVPKDYKDLDYKERL